MFAMKFISSEKTSQNYQGLSIKWHQRHLWSICQNIKKANLLTIDFYNIVSSTNSRDAPRGGGRGAAAPPDFGRSEGTL